MIAPYSSILSLILCVGDLTEQGYNNKLSQLEKKYQTTSQATPPSTTAENLANPDPKIRQQIRSLYGRSKERSSVAGFSPSAVSTAKSATKSKGKKTAQSTNHIVVVCVPETTYVVPKRKRRDALISQGMVKELAIKETSSEEEIFVQIADLFPSTLSSSTLQLLKVLPSQELIPVGPVADDGAWDGAAILMLANKSNGNLYIKPKPTQKAQLSQTQLQTGLRSLQSPQNSGGQEQRPMCLQPTIYNPQRIEICHSPRVFATVLGSLPSRPMQGMANSLVPANTQVQSSSLRPASTQVQSSSLRPANISGLSNTTRPTANALAGREFHFDAGTT